MAITQRTFPVMERGGGAVLNIPWPIGEEAWLAYSRRYGAKQSCERIAQRGGFYAEEMDQFRPEWCQFVINLAGR